MCQPSDMDGTSSLQSLVPRGGAEAGPLFSSPILVQSTLENYISQPSLQIGLGYRVWVLEIGTRAHDVIKITDHKIAAQCPNIATSLALEQMQGIHSEKPTRC